jgi:hypothetical protein
MISASSTELFCRLKPSTSALALACSFRYACAFSWSSQKLCALARSSISAIRFSLPSTSKKTSKNGQPFSEFDDAFAQRSDFHGGPQRSSKTAFWERP